MNPDTQQPILRPTVILSADAGEHRFVTVTGGKPAAGGNAYGPAYYAGKTGAPVPVTALGIATGVASAAIVRGAALEVAADGKVKTRTGNNVIVGRALTAAAADGDKLAVHVIPN